MPISFRREDRQLFAAISGEIDHHGAKAVMQELELQIAQHMPLTLILDCAGIGSGIAVLLRAWQQVHGFGGSMTVLHMPSQPSRVLKAAGLDRLMTLS